MIRLAHYIRVSDLGERDVEAASTQTIDQQRDGAQAIAKLSAATIVHEAISTNVSGGKMWPEPKLAELIRRVDAGEFDGIVVYDLARFGRHLAALEVIERWAEEGKTFLSANDTFDARSASGRMCLRMMMVVARFYWEESRDRFARSQAKAYARGAHIGRTPFGYLRVTDERSIRLGCLVVDPEWGPVVTEAFKVAAADGMHACMAYLNKAAPDVRRWLTDDVRRLLSCRTYLGEVSLNGDRKRAHKPLTTLATWTAAQTEPGTRASNGDYPLSKIATCASCHEGLTGQLAQHPRDKSIRYRRMRCSNKDCIGRPSISADALEEAVRETLRRELRANEWRWRVRYEAVGLADAEQVLLDAEAERQAFASDVEWIAALGREAAKANALALSAKVAEAQAAYDAIAATSAMNERLPGADELDDNEQLLRAIDAVVGSIVVSKGRRGRYAQPIAERVTVTDVDGTVLDLYDGARVAAA